MKNIKISPYFFIIFLISVFLGIYKNFLLAFFTVFFHEAGHLLFINKSKIEINYIKIEPFGITIRLKSFFIKNNKEEILIALWGPLFNFILAFLSFVFFKEKLMFFTLSNLSMGVFNLLPAYPLDGGRILRAFFSEKIGYLKSYRLTFKATKIISSLITVMGLFVIYKTKFNFSVCIIGAFLLFNLAKEKNQTYYYLLKELTDYKEKNKDIDKMPVKYIAVNKNFIVRKILCELSFSRYHIFSVIEKGKIIATFTEGELMEGIIKKGSKVKICDLM